MGIWMEQSDTYTCAACARTFRKGQSDAAALAELAKNFPDTKPEDCGIVCDDCYRRLMRFFNGAE